jgi:hypothetical protein
MDDQRIKDVLIDVGFWFIAPEKLGRKYKAVYAGVWEFVDDDTHLMIEITDSEYFIRDGRSDRDVVYANFSFRDQPNLKEILGEVIVNGNNLKNN